MEVTCWSWKKKVERLDASSSPFDLLLLLLNAFKLFDESRFDVIVDLLSSKIQWRCTI